MNSLNTSFRFVFLRSIFKMHLSSYTKCMEALNPDKTERKNNNKYIMESSM